MPYYRLFNRTPPPFGTDTPIYTSTHAHGPFARTYTPAVGNEEHGKALFLYTDLEVVQAHAQRGNREEIWEVEPTSAVYLLNGWDDLIGNVYWSHERAAEAGRVWDGWYAAVQNGSAATYMEQVSRSVSGIGTGGAGCTVAVTDSFRYVREITPDWVLGIYLEPGEEWNV